MHGYFWDDFGTRPDKCDGWLPRRIIIFAEANEVVDSIENFLCETSTLRERRLATLDEEFPGNFEEVRMARSSDIFSRQTSISS